MSARFWGAATAAVLLLALGACGSDDDGSTASSPTTGSEASPPSSGGTAPSKEELNGRTYEATSVEGHELIPGTTLRVGFDNDHLVARAGCNTLQAAYSFEGTTLKWTGEPMATMMGCPQELLDQDQWLTELFTNGVQASVDQFGANLTNDEVTIQLIRDDGGV